MTLLTRAQFVTRAINLIGRDYIYGGRDPETGFDCFGYVPAAFTLGGDLETSKKLHSWFTGSAFKALPEIKTSEGLLAGDLVFYGPGAAKHPNDAYAQVDHVAIYVGSGVVLSASGGDSTVLTPAAARAKGAFARAHSTWLYRGDVVGFRSMEQFFRV